MNIPQKHQLKIARDTLKMTPTGALILGGMSYSEAYEIVFKTPLQPRLESLISEYGEKGPYSWELERYGWTPGELIKLI